MTSKFHRKGNGHKFRIGEEVINELERRGEVTVDPCGRVYGIEGFIKRSLGGRR